MIDEVLRPAIAAIVWTVLILRGPFMIRDKQQRPLLGLLLVFAGTSIIIQPWVRLAIGHIVPIPQFYGLIEGLWGLLSIAATLSFVVHLTGSTGRTRLNGALRTISAVIAAMAMILFFALTPAAQRFSNHPVPGMVTAYALVTASYMVPALIATAWILWRRLPHVQGRTLYAALLMFMVGDILMVLFMAVRTAGRLTTIASWLPALATTLSTGRLILLPLSIAMVAAEPLRTRTLYWYRRIRLYGLWHLLRDATSELVTAPMPTRWQDLRTINYAWERLHLRVVETRDSMFYLHDAWATPDLLKEATHYAHNVAKNDRRRIATIACWLETTRRAATTGTPKLHHPVNKDLLPELVGDASTLHVEMRYLLQLHRTLQSRPVQAFADRAAQPTPTTSTGQIPGL